MIEATVTGFAELDKLMRGLPKGLEVKVVRGMVMAGGQLVAKEAAVKAPIANKPHRSYDGKYTIMPGALRASIKTWSVRKDTRATVMNVVGPRKFRGVDTFYWKFLEFGTRYVSARPFLRPAFEHNVQRIIDMMRSRMERGIKSAWKKVG
jgi:HK97 gp10 family phage protein